MLKINISGSTGSGKTTVANEIKARAESQGAKVLVIDGDSCVTDAVIAEFMAHAGAHDVIVTVQPNWIAPTRIQIGDTSESRQATEDEQKYFDRKAFDHRKTLGLPDEEANRGLINTFQSTNQE